MTFSQRRDALSWGRINRSVQNVAAPSSREHLDAVIADKRFATVLPVGMRRSYGDSVLNSNGGIVEMSALNTLIDLDVASGRLKAEAGVTLDAILRTVVPRGYFVPVTPGTRYVTLGGAIANDVHGKNHHRAGSFGNHVLRLGLLRSDGSRIEIGPDDKSGLFSATVGGLGLTGIIEWADIRLQPIRNSYLDIEILPFTSLAEFWTLAEESTASHEHTVAWIDCTAKGRNGGRGIFSRGNWSAEGDLSAHSTARPLNIPMDAPSWLLNPVTVGLFNRIYYAGQKRKAGELRQHYAKYFYPLDAVTNWNRLYSRRGFWQYQCVIPKSSMREATSVLLGEIAESGQGSFLAVLKTFGEVPSVGYLSFPHAGATLALDFPNKGKATLQLFARLDEIVREAGGRLYAAKDGRIPRNMWSLGYPELERFTEHLDPGLASDFWRRVAP